MPQNNIALQERNVFECMMFYYNCSGNTNVYCFSTSDEEVTLVIDGNNVVFKPGNLQRSEIVHGSGEAADRVTIVAAIDDTLMQMMVENRINVGLSCKIYSVYTDTIQSSYNDTEYFVEFWGEAVSSARQENTFSVDFQGWNGKLTNTGIPKILFSRTSQQAVYRECTFKLQRSSFTFQGEITSISSDRFNITVELDDPDVHIDDAFTAGICQFTNVPTEITINKDITDGSDPTVRSITLMEKCPLSLIVGEIVQLSYGLDMSFNGANGFAKFNNWENFDGIPYIRITDASLETLG